MAGDWWGRSVLSPAPAVDGWLPGEPVLTAVDTELHWCCILFTSHEKKKNERKTWVNMTF